MRALTLLAVSALCGCSIIVGGAPPECTPGAGECAILNELEGIDPAGCELYQCSEQTRTCALSIRDQDGDGLIAPECADLSPLPVDCNDTQRTGDEVCNGLDDDCDGIIDESVTPSSPTLLMSVSAGRIGYGAAVGAVAVARSEGGNTLFGLVDGETVTGPTPMSSRRATDLTSLSDDALSGGCNRLRPDGSTQSTNCLFDDVGLGLADANVFAAYVSTDGCGLGQLRVGYFERSAAAAPGVIERGPPRRSNAFLGIDTDPTMPTNGQCTGASRAGGPFGAARPSVAVSGDDDALVAYLGDTVERAECGGAEIDVEVLGLFVEEDRAGSPYGWVTASNEGAPQRVGRTTGGGRPGVVAWSGRGYIVGFGAPSGDVQLVMIPVPDAPPAYDRLMAPESRVGRETAALSVMDLGTLPAGGADDVVLSIGSARAGGIEVGVAWREGCGSGAESVHFRQVFVTNEVAIDEARSFAAVELGTAGAAGAPAIAYVFEGMIQPGIARPDGRPVGEASNDGGWAIAWEDDDDVDPGPGDDSRIFVARVSEADGRALGEPAVVHALTDQRHEQPVLYRTSGNELRVAFLETGGDVEGITGGSLSCSPMSAP